MIFFLTGNNAHDVDAFLIYDYDYDYDYDFQRKKSDPKLDNIRLRKIAVEILGL